jgi:hypothetical protein
MTAVKDQDKDGAPSNSIVKESPKIKVNTIEEFVGYAKSWIDYPKKSPTVGDVIGDSEL